MCGRLIPFISHLIIHALNDSMGSVFCVRFFFFVWQEENIEKINVKRLKKQRQTVKYISGLRRKNSKMGSFMFTWILTWTKKIMYNANRFTYYAHTHAHSCIDPPFVVRDICFVCLWYARCLVVIFMIVFSVYISRMCVIRKKIWRYVCVCVCRCWDYFVRERRSFLPLPRTTWG